MLKWSHQINQFNTENDGQEHLKQKVNVVIMQNKFGPNVKQFHRKWKREDKIRGFY